MDIPVVEGKEMTNLYLLIAIVIIFAIVAIRLWRTENQWLGAGFGLLAIVGTISIMWAVVMIFLLS